MVLAAAALVLAALVLAALAQPAKPRQEASVRSVYDFTVVLNDGRKKSLADYRGKVLLIVNTASKCGFTPQYAGLENLYEKYLARGFAILAFPANEFGAQEPGSDDQIREFCSTKYHVTFDLFAKSVVKGPGISPLYRFLTAESGFPGEITWNFNKFLVDRKGRVAARFESKVTPDSPKLTAAVENLLAEAP